MTIIDRSVHALERAERELRGLLSEAAGSGDYQSVVQIADWARQLTEMTGPAKARESVPVAPPDGGAQPSEQRARRAAGSKRRVPASEYPRFYREGKRIVRVAWSKRERKEYEHKAPRDVLQLLAKALKEHGADGRIFTTEQLLPITSLDGVEYPAYQAYVGLGLLRKVGLLDQHGRKGYSIAKSSELEQAVEGLWRNLPAK
jgi:hypothetical protein